MKKIKLNGKYGAGKFALVDDEDFDLVNSFNWYLSGSYPVRSLGKRPNRTKISMHRFLMNTPVDKVTDHINGNGLDNRKSNLRICTISENTINSKKSINKSSKYKGVSFINPWRAYIGRKILGHFKTEKEAAEAYNKAAKELYFDFARLNIID
jgi:HNH endonuclease